VSPASDVLATLVVTTTAMTKLSPAAEKVLRADAAMRCLAEWSSVNDPPCHPSDEGWNGCGTCVNRAAVAAALEAAADQVVPYFDEPDWGACDRMRCDIELYTDHMRKRSQILAIAAELRGNTTPTENN